MQSYTLEVSGCCGRRCMSCACFAARLSFLLRCRSSRPQGSGAVPSPGTGDDFFAAAGGAAAKGSAGGGRVEEASEGGVAVG